MHIRFHIPNIPLVSIVLSGRMRWKPFSIARPPSLAAVDNNLLWISLLFFCVACFDSLGIVVSPFTLLAVCSFRSLPASLCARLQGSLNKHKMATRAWIRQQHDVCICSTYNIYTLHTLRHLPTPTHTHTPTYTHALSPYEKQTNCHADAENANKKCVRGKERKGERDLFCWCWVNVFKIVVKFIGYENLMICKVADKRGAPPGDTSKQQKPKPEPSAECERILGIYSNINICLFLQPPFVWLGLRLCDCEIDENFVG